MRGKKVRVGVRGKKMELTSCEGSERKPETWKVGVCNALASKEKHNAGA